jgi:hypothetical protein
MNKGMSTADRRDCKRSPIKVLVKCLPADASIRGGGIAKAWKMLARNIADDGVSLHWSRTWSSLNCPHCLKWPADEAQDTQICLCSPPQETLQTGQQIELDGLVYGDCGSQPMRGLIRWVRPDKKGERTDMGILITTPRHRDYFRALEQ